MSDEEKTNNIYYFTSPYTYDIGAHNAHVVCCLFETNLHFKHTRARAARAHTHLHSHLHTHHTNQEAFFLRAGEVCVRVYKSDDDRYYE